MTIHVWAKRKNQSVHECYYRVAHIEYVEKLIEKLSKNSYTNHVNNINIVKNFEIL